MNPPVGDKPNNDQLRSLLEAFHTLDELLSGLDYPGQSSRYQTHILQQIAATLPVETLAWIPSIQEENVLVEGSQLFPSRAWVELAGLLSKSPEWENLGWVIINQVPSCHLGDRFPKIQNLIALAVGDHHPQGCLLAINKSDVVAPAQRSPERDGDSSPVPISFSGLSPVERLQPVPFRRIDAALLMPFGSLLGLQSRSLAISSRSRSSPPGCSGP